MTGSEPILQVEHLSKKFTTGKKTFHAVDDVSFVLREGESLGLVGESGSGKSTIARCIMQLTAPSEGTIRLFGKDITALRGKQARELYRSIQMVFQFPQDSFDPRRTLGYGIRESLRNFGFSPQDAAKRTEEALIQCGLPSGYASRYPHEVSGGECQRAAIARAIGIQPKVLILDEATSALDVTVQKNILELLVKLKQEMGLSFLFICHDLAVVQQVCDSAVVLNHGHIEEAGTVEEVLLTPQTAYTRKLLDSVL